MKVSIRAGVIAFFVALLPLVSSATDLEIGRMRVAVWPEYDSSGVLFIYDGRFRDEGAFPAEASFYIPKGAVISDACSLSPKGTHFCQLYEQKSFDDRLDVVTLKLPYPNFYLSFHTDPFTGGADERSLTHAIRAGSNIDRLEVDVQSPLRAEGFSLTAGDGFDSYEKDGFTHYGRIYDNIAKGSTLEVGFRYVKRDRSPSVDIKYSAMKPGEAVKPGDTPYGRQRRFTVYIYAAAVAGIAVLIGLVYAVVRSGGRKSA